MKRASLLVSMSVASLFLTEGGWAQQRSPGGLTPGGAVPRLIKYSGVVNDPAGRPRTGIVGLMFAVYAGEEGGSPLWQEVQNVPLDDLGHYTALLGSTRNEGLPLELFISGEPRWLGVQPQFPGEVEQPRVLLVSVPFALKAADAQTLGGLPASAFSLAKTGAQAESAGTRQAADNAALHGSVPTNTISKGGANSNELIGTNLFEIGNLLTANDHVVVTMGAEESCTGAGCKANYETCGDGSCIADASMCSGASCTAAKATCTGPNCVGEDVHTSCSGPGCGMSSHAGVQATCDGSNDDMCTAVKGTNMCHLGNCSTSVGVSGSCMGGSCTAVQAKNTCTGGSCGAAVSASCNDAGCDLLQGVGPNGSATITGNGVFVGNGVGKNFEFAPSNQIPIPGTIVKRLYNPSFPLVPAQPGDEGEILFVVVSVDPASPYVTNVKAVQLGTTGIRLTNLGQAGVGDWVVIAANGSGYGTAVGGTQRPPGAVGKISGFSNGQALIDLVPGLSTPAASGGGGGTVTSVSITGGGPLFTATTTNQTTTPQINLAPVLIPDGSILGNFSGGSAPPSFLTLAIGGDVITQRQNVSSVPYALSARVDGIQGIPISPAAPADGQILKYNAAANAWQPAPGGVTSISATAPLTVGGSSAIPSISLGTVPISLGGTGLTGGPASATQFLRSDGIGGWKAGSITSGDLPAITLGGDASGSLSSTTVTGLQGHAISNATPSLGNALTYTATGWSPVQPAIITAGTGLTGGGSVTPGGGLTLGLATPPFTFAWNSTSSTIGTTSAPLAFTNQGPSNGITYNQAGNSFILSGGTYRVSLTITDIEAMSVIPSPPPSTTVACNLTVNSVPVGPSVATRVVTNGPSASLNLNSLVTVQGGSSLAVQCQQSQPSATVQFQVGISSAASFTLIIDWYAVAP